MKGRVLAILALCAAPALADDLIIAEGESVTVTLPFVPRGGLTVVSDEVVEVATDVRRQTITFTGRTRGRSLRTVVDASDPSRLIEYEIDVVTAKLKRTHSYYVEQCHGIWGVEVRIQGDNVIVEGDVDFEAEMLRVKKLTSDERGNPLPHVVDLVRMTPAHFKRRGHRLEIETGAEPPPSPTELTLEAGSAVVVWLPFLPGTGVNSNSEIIRVFPSKGSRSLFVLARNPGEARYTMFEVGTTRKVEYRIVVGPESP